MFSTESETITKKKWLIKFFETPTAPAQFHCPKELPSLWCSTSCIFVFLIKEWRYRSCWTLCEASGSGSMRRIVGNRWLFHIPKFPKVPFLWYDPTFPYFCEFFLVYLEKRPCGEPPFSCTFHESSQKLATWFWGFCWGLGTRACGLGGRKVASELEVDRPLWWKDNRS